MMPRRKKLGLLLGAMLMIAMPVGLPPALADKPETIAPSVHADFSVGKLVAVASCAADLYPPSADVARLKAERVARSRAEDKLRKALLLLVRDHKAKLGRFGGAEQVAKLDPKTAVVEKIDYGATGGVVLWLSLSLAGGKDHAKSDGAAETAAPDAGAVPPEEH
jgi:hypothetical protein